MKLVAIHRPSRKLAVLTVVIAAVMAGAVPALAGLPAYTLDCATVSYGGGVVDFGSVIIVGQPLVGTISNANYTIELGFLPCLLPRPNSTVTCTWNRPAASAGIWNNEDNRLPVFVPNNSTNTYYRAFIRIPPGSGFPSVNVKLDISPTIAFLSVAGGAILEVDQISPGSQTLGFFPLSSTTNATNGGTIRVRATTADRIFTINDMELLQQPAGELAAQGSATHDATLRLVDSRVTGGAVRALGTNSVVVLRNSTLVDAVVDGLVYENGQTSSELQDQITNNGTVAILGTGGQPSIVAPSVAGATLAGSGKVTLSDPAGSTLGGAGRPLANGPTHRIEGAGEILGALHNLGTVEANSSGLAISVDCSDGVVHEGMFRAVNNGVLRLVGGFITSNGQYEADGGSIEVATGLEAPWIEGASLSVLNDGVFEVSDDAYVDMAGAVLLDEGGVYRAAGASSSAVLVAGSLTIEGNGSGPGPSELAMRDSMGTLVESTFSMLTCVARLRGCIPPWLRVEDNAGFDVNGDFSIMTDAQVTVTSSQPVTLGGDFNNQSQNPALFEWRFGGLRLDGTSPQAFEAGGADLGLSPDGFINNFAFGEIEVSSNGSVTFENQHANASGPSPCVEALYVRDLVLRGGAQITLDDCRVYYGDLADEGASISSAGCGQLLHNPTGDANLDGAVDLADYQEWPGCLGGPAAAGMPAGCGVFDFDSNGRIDLVDYAALQAAF